MKREMEYYPLGDRLTPKECERLGIPTTPAHAQNAVMACWTGDQRPPRRGEWYLSGALPTAYRAPNDFSIPFRIARLVKIERRVIQVIVEVPENTDA